MSGGKRRFDEMQALDLGIYWCFGHIPLRISLLHAFSVTYYGLRALV
jgi:hypothetical protein